MGEWDGMRWRYPSPFPIHPIPTGITLSHPSEGSPWEGWSIIRIDRNGNPSENIYMHSPFTVTPIRVTIGPGGEEAHRKRKEPS